MKFERIPRNKLAETVAKQLLAGLRAGNTPPGERIPSERELMGAFGVGRSTVREAVNGLAMLRVLEIRHGQGVFVTSLDCHEDLPRAIAVALARGVTRDLFEARQLVEPHVARLAALRRTDADLQKLADSLTDHETAIAHGAPAVEPSVRFHVSVGEAAHSEVLACFIASAAEIMIERGPVLEAERGYREWEVEQHRSVYTPIRVGDPDAAEQRMRAHLEAVIPRHQRLGLP